MKCHDAKRRLDLFLDGELDTDANMEVLQHLNLCAPCSKIYEGEKELRSLLKDHKVKAPSHLMDTIDRRIRRRALPLQILSAAAAVLLALGALLLFAPAVTNYESVAYAAVDAHATPAEGVCVRCLDREEVRHYYDREVGYQPCVHDLSKAGFDWEYASRRGTVINGRMVCWLVHRKGAERAHISQASFPLDMLDKLEGGEKVNDVRVFRINGRVVAVRKCGKMICVFVADDAKTGETMIAAVSMP